MAASDPNYAPTVNQFFPIKVSVSSEASAAAAQVGPFRGVYVKVSSSFTIVGIDGVSLQVNDHPRSVPILWIQGYLSALNASAATATATVAGVPLIYGVI